jgi:ABC-type transport system involved in multi-copper enzyme maturation permease subunit
LLETRRTGSAALPIYSGGPEMVFQIAKKDFLNNLLSARFIIGFILCLFLIPFSILISIDDYREKDKLFQSDRDATEKAVKQVRVYSGLRPEIFLPPEPLSVFSRGISGQVGNRMKILLGEKPMLAAGQAATRENPFLASFFSVDFVGIAAIIFSLLGLLFSYDAFTREKELGTLRLLMSNPLGRARFLAGKVLGILSTLLPVLVFCFLLSAVLILLSKNLSLSAVDWERIALLAVVSLIYLAVFVFIGLFVSARSKTSVTSLTLCLFLWVFFAFIVPNLSGYFGESFVRVQSRDNLNRVLADLDKEMKKKVEEFANALPEPDSSHYTYLDYWSYVVRADGYKEMYGSTRSIFDRQRQISAYSEPLRIDYADKKWVSQKAYLDSLIRQAQVADLISMISPAGAFRIVASAICATDRNAHERTMDAARTYRETFIGYLRGKDIFRSFLWITAARPESFLTIDAIVAKRTGGEFKTLQAYSAWAVQQKNLFERYRKLTKVKVPGEQPDDYPHLNVNDMPVYPGSRVSLLVELELNIFPLSLLIVEGIFLFYLGYVAFIRYDVR